FGTGGDAAANAAIAARHTATLPRRAFMAALSWGFALNARLARRLAKSAGILYSGEAHESPSSHSLVLPRLPFCGRLRPYGMGKRKTRIWRGQDRLGNCHYRSAKSRFRWDNS